MFNDQDNPELMINRLLDAELTADAELELNRTLIRDPEMMRVREDYQKIDALAVAALGSIHGGAEIDLNTVFAAEPVATRTSHFRSRSIWIMIPGAIAAALLAMVIPYPDDRGAASVPSVTSGDPYRVTSNTPWNGSDLARPVSTVPKIRSRTGRDIIGVVGDDGNLYWIEVEKRQTVRWPAGPAFAPDVGDSM